MNDDRSHPSIARRNRRDVLGAIVVNGPLSRTEISHHTGLHVASVSRITKSLIGAELICERTEVSIPGKPGRRFIELELNPEGGYVIGIAINALEQSVTLATIKNERIDRADLQFENILDTDALIEAIISCAQDMILRNNVSRTRIFGASVAVTGVIDTKTGAVVTAPTMGWKDVQLREKLSNGLDLDVTVENLPNAINLAEHRFGIAADFSSTLLMNTALGVGSSLLLNGQLHRGLNGSGMLAGEVPLTGHGEQSARPLNLAAGSRGILVEAGMTVSEAQQLSPFEATRCHQKLIAEAEKGDPDIVNAFRKSGRMLGEFMAIAGSVVQPDAFIVSGPLGQVPAYAQGCKAALEARVPEGSLIFRISSMTTQSAARWLAIGTYLIDRDLELSYLSLSDAA